MITLVTLVTASLFVLSASARAYVPLIFAILVEQELVAGGNINDTGPLVSAASEVWYATTLFGIPVVTALSLVLIALGWSVFFAPGARLPAATMSVFIAWVVLLGTLQGESLTDSLASAQSLIAALAGFVSGCMMNRDGSRDAAAKFCAVLACVVGLKAILGASALALGQGAEHDGVVPIAFYDSVVMLVAAGSLAVGLIYSDRSKLARWALLASSLLLAGVSIRRASLVGAILVLLICALAARRVSLSLKLAYGAIVGGALLSLVFPRLLDSTAGSIRAAWTGLTGGSDSDASTRGHLRDNEAGMRLALENPVEGVGVRATPTSDFVVRQGELLYVHNEFLYGWLHFGIVGLVLISILVIHSGIASVRLLVASESAPPWSIFGAAFLLAAVPGYWFFPHLLTLDRFALLFGWSLGAVVCRSLSKLERFERATVNA